MPKFTVQRSTTIAVPIDQAHTAVRDFKGWREWSPWLISEPDCKLTYSDDGDSYAWDGQIVGAGEMRVVGGEAPRSIEQKLTFLRPFKSKADVRFDFAERDGGTEVTWTMNGGLPFFMFFLKGMMTAFIGMDYERGLMMLKDKLETGSVPSKLEFLGVQKFEGCRYLGVHSHCKIAELSNSMGRDVEKLLGWFEEHKAEPVGKMFSIYHQWKPTKGTAEYTLAFPIEGDPPPGHGFKLGDIPPCTTYNVKHTGPYRYLGNAWSSGVGHARAKVYRKNNAIHPFEIYENSPHEVEENELVTVVHFAAR